MRKYKVLDLELAGIILKGILAPELFIGLAEVPLKTEVQINFDFCLALFFSGLANMISE